jgi:hypothetical protein
LRRRPRRHRRRFLFDARADRREGERKYGTMANTLVDVPLLCAAGAGSGGLCRSRRGFWKCRR